MTATEKEIKNSPDNLYPYHLVGIIEKQLGKYLSDYRDIPGELSEPIKYCIINGGKRLRPVLCAATAIGFGCKPADIIPTACSVEFIHSYSLIHDDLPAIDDDDIRRGKPSCHKRFGEAAAILTGDALFAEAFNLILKYQICSPGKKLRVLSEIVDASGAAGMVAGQIVDISSASKKISKKKLEHMHINKTARLISASVVSSAILCGAKEGTIEGLRKYGMNIGLAFQITDDIIDIISSSSISGKTQGKDRIQSKNTYPFLWGLDKSRRIAEEKIDTALDAIKGLHMDSRLLEDIAKFILLRKA